MQTNINQQNKSNTNDPIIDVLVATTLVFAGIGVIKTLDWLLGGDNSQYKTSPLKNYDTTTDFNEEEILNTILKEKRL